MAFLILHAGLYISCLYADLPKVETLLEILRELYRNAATIFDPTKCSAHRHFGDELQAGAICKPGGTTMTTEMKMTQTVHHRSVVRTAIFQSNYVSQNELKPCYRILTLTPYCAISRHLFGLALVSQIKAMRCELHRFSTYRSA